jgi:hypothetical protein
MQSATLPSRLTSCAKDEIEGTTFPRHFGWTATFHFPLQIAAISGIKSDWAASGWHGNEPRLGVLAMSDAQMDSRLVVPPLPPRFLPRPRLLAMLYGSADMPLVLLAAGPGAGKTVLLSSWARRSGIPVLWITVTASDAAPQRFWRLLWSALKAHGGKYEGAFPVAPPGDTTERVQALLGWLPDSPVPPVLVIDDAHLLTHPDVLEDLDGLVRSGVPPRLRLMLAARSDRCCRCTATGWPGRCASCAPGTWR